MLAYSKEENIDPEGHRIQAHALVHILKISIEVILSMS